MKQQEIIQEINNPKIIFLGCVVDILEKHNVKDKKDIKAILDNCEMRLNNKQRRFIYQQRGCF